MKKTGLIFLAGAFASGLFSCTRNEEWRSDLDIVNVALYDTTSAYHASLRALDTLGRMNSIAVVGPVEETIAMSEYILGCDLHDNASGVRKSDQLPDFSGETISPLFDLIYSDYDTLSVLRKDQIRNLAVENALFAISNSCHVNPYDDLRSGFKSASKLLVLSSSYMSAFGRSDIDTLFVKNGSGIAVVDPVSAMRSELAERQTNSSVVGVWASEGILATNVYDDALRDRSQGVFCFTPDTLESHIDAFVRFLDLYMDSGNTHPLSALLIDECVYSDDDILDFQRIANSILRCDEDYMIRFKGLVTPDFTVIGSLRSVAEDCYRKLRKDNLFTLKIHYPDVQAYINMESRVPEIDEMSIVFNQRYLPPYVIESIQQNTVLLSDKLYVY